MVQADTQIVLRLARESHLLSPAATNALAQAAQSEGIAIAAVTLWEIAMLHSKKRIQIEKPIDAFLKDIEDAYVVLPLNREIAIRGCAFSKRYPKDPADRQIGATALVHGLTLVTSDRLIRKSGEVPCIW